MKGLLFVFIGLLIFKEVYVLPIDQENDTDIGFVSPKNSSNVRRIMTYNKKPTRESEESKEILDSIVLAIDTGVRKFMRSRNKPDVVDDIANSFLNFAKRSVNNPVYRSKGEEYNIKPEIVHFRGKKPSVMLEINSKSLFSGLKDLLRSKVVRQLMEHYSKEAAVIYRSLKNELEKSDKPIKRTRN